MTRKDKRWQDVRTGRLPAPVEQRFPVGIEEYTDVMVYGEKQFRCRNVRGQRPLASVGGKK